jgi:hypothetical protein
MTAARLAALPAIAPGEARSGREPALDLRHRASKSPLTNRL